MASSNTRNRACLPTYASKATPHWPTYQRFDGISGRGMYILRLLSIVGICSHCFPPLAKTNDVIPSTASRTRAHASCVLLDSTLFLQGFCQILTMRVSGIVGIGSQCSPPLAKPNDDNSDTASRTRVRAYCVLLDSAWF